MGAETNQQYRERLMHTAEQLRQNGEDAFDETVALFRELSTQSGEKLQDLHDEIDAVKTAFNGVEVPTQTEVAQTLRDLFGVVGAQLDQLRNDVAQLSNNQARELNRDFSYSGIMNSIAFSLGGLLQQVDNDQENPMSFFGLNLGKFLAPLKLFVGMERIELANALKGKQFTGIESSQGSAKSVMNVLKTRPGLQEVQPETFALLLADAARKKFPTAQTVSYAQLETLAKTMELPEKETPSSQS